MGNLQIAFVSMIFALALTEAARRVGVLYFREGRFGREAWPALSHLFLSLVVIATSFVQWMQSPLSDKVVEVFGSQFLVLLVNVAIAMMYYVLVMGVEIGEDGQVKPPSARHEADWMLYIFAAYLLYDLLTKWLIPSFFDPWSFFPRGWVSLACFLCALLTWRTLRSVERSAGRVIVADLFLLLLVVLFRAMKRLAPIEGEKWMDTIWFISFLASLVLYVIIVKVLFRKRLS